MSNNTNITSRENNLNIIRFIAAIMVIYGHMYPIMGQWSYTVMNQAVSTIAVEIFFVISGYLITISFLNEKSMFCYAVKRVFRIIPGLLALCVVTAFVIGPLVSNYSISVYFSEHFREMVDYMKNVLLFPMYGLPGLFLDNVYPVTVNGSLWTLPVEFALYFIVPLLIVITGRKKGYKYGLIVVFVVVLIFNTVKLEKYPDARLVIWGTDVMSAMNLVPYFLIGAIFTFEKVKKCLNIQVGIILFFVAIMMNMSYPKTQVIMVFVLPYFIFSFAFASKPVFAKFGTKVDLSYGIYLYGFLIQQILSKYLLKYDLSVNIMFVISTLLSICCAFASWYLVEKPMQKLGKKIVKKYKSRKEA